MSNKQKTTFTTCEPTAILRYLVSLKDINVLAYHRTGPSQAIEIEQALDDPRCEQCGDRAYIKDRPKVRYIDLPVFGRPMSLLWRKHRLYCPNPDCQVTTWTNQDKRIASVNAKLTTRAAKWATKQVGCGRTVSEVATELGCDWHTVNDTVTVYGQALLETDHKRVCCTFR
ncbi:transposase family protein [Corynebacterium spheniscorum]|nr:transposase family protein [Corynebacterium spheniscorum]KAA8720419.1 transposase family protein [Corynebacterium spheniscorum]